jgi:ankyrin repeat protein
MRRLSKTALFGAAKSWNVAVLEGMLATYPDLIRAIDAKGRTALHLACSAKPGAPLQGEPHGIRTVSALLAAGAALETEVPVDADEGDFRATPVWYAVARGKNPELVRFLLSCGVNASYSLWAVVWRDDDALCRDLLKSGPRLNLGAHGETPILYAARPKRLKTLGLLIEAGADPTIVDAHGRNAVDMAGTRRLPADLIASLAALAASVRCTEGART